MNYLKHTILELGYQNGPSLILRKINANHLDSVNPDSCFNPVLPKKSLCDSQMATRHCSAKWPSCTTTLRSASTWVAMWQCLTLIKIHHFWKISKCNYKIYIYTPKFTITYTPWPMGLTSMYYIHRCIWIESKLKWNDEMGCDGKWTDILVKITRFKCHSYNYTPSSCSKPNTVTLQCHSPPIGDDLRNPSLALRMVHCWDIQVYTSAKMGSPTSSAYVFKILRQQDILAYIESHR